MMESRYLCTKDFTIEGVLERPGSQNSIKCLKGIVYEFKSFHNDIYIMYYKSQSGTKVYAPLDKFPDGNFITLSDQRENKLRYILNDLV